MTRARGAGTSARLAGALLLACAVGCGEPGPTGPSIVLVVVDTLRADYLGCYGFEGDTSPHLDRLAAEGVLFERCFAEAPWTKPSVATLLTSLPPRAHGVLTHQGRFGDGRPGDVPEGAAAETDVLPEAARTLPEALRGAGYRTAAFVANPWLRREWGFAQGFEAFEELDRHHDNAEPLLVRATQWLEETGRAPSFLYLHLMDVHGPYAAPEADFAAVVASAGLGEHLPLDERAFARIPDYLRLPAWADEPPARDGRTWRARYAAGVRAVDRRIGALLEYLAVSGRADDTLFVVVSDHGEELLDHGGWDHGASLYDHQTHVPWILRLPDGAHAGTRVPGLCGLADVMPTVLSLAGVPIPPSAHGVDRSGFTAANDDLASTLSEGVKWRPDLLALRTTDYKLVTDLARGETQLFHLPSDPGERRNLARSQPETVAILMEVLRDQLERASRGALSPETARVSAALEERLNDLGY